MLNGYFGNPMGQPLHDSDPAEVVQPRTSEPASHVMHGRHWGVAQLRDLRGAPQSVDQIRSERVHADENAKMACSKQGVKCHNGSCHYGSVGCLTMGMENETIRRLMKERGYNQADLAELLGIDPTAVSKRLTGKRPFKHNEIIKIESWLGAAPTPSALAASAVRTVPIIGRVAAGAYKEAIQQPLGHLPVPADAPKNAIALRVDGDSMDLEIDDGGTVVVDLDDRALFPGKLYVIINEDGETTFKQFEADPARLEPRSTNPAHKPIVMGDGQAFTVFGRVTALYRLR
ncbi:MAG: LexA family transcriptional regulator [Sphingomonas sp.]|nr:LexA family transcriptional regulator [Sphingomonas sp.]